MFSIQYSVFSDSARQLYRRSSPTETAHTIFEEIASSLRSSQIQLLMRMVVPITTSITQRQQPVLGWEQLEGATVSVHQVFGAQGFVGGTDSEQFLVEQHDAVEAFGCHLQIMERDEDGHAILL